MKRLLLLLILPIMVNVNLIAQTLDVSNSFITSNRASDVKPLKLINNVPTSDSVLTRPSYYNKFDPYKNSILKNNIDDSILIASMIKNYTNKRNAKKLDTATSNQITKEIDSLRENLIEKTKLIDSIGQSLTNSTMLNIDLQSNQLNIEVGAAKSEIESYRIEINKNVTSSSFDNKTFFDYLDSKNQHIIDSMFNFIAVNSIKQSVSLEKDVQPLLDSMVIYYNQINDRRNDVTKYPDKKVDIIEIINADLDKYKKEKEKFLKTKEIFVSEFEKYKSVSNDLSQKINTKTQEIKATKEKNVDSSVAISALGGITQVLGDQSLLIPNISIIGSKKFRSDLTSSFFGEIKLFIGGTNTNKNTNSVNNLFVPEASTYGFMTDFTFGFISAAHNPSFNKELDHYDQKLGINIGGYFLGKKMQPDSLHSFSTSVFHLKLGIQYILIPHFLSVYLNTNGLVVGTGADDFGKYYNNEKKFKSFASFGIQSYLDVSEKSDFHIALNLGFVTTGGDVNELVKTNDRVIPTIKLAMVKSFTF